MEKVYCYDLVYDLMQDPRMGASDGDDADVDADVDAADDAGAGADTPEMEEVIARVVDAVVVPDVGGAVIAVADAG